MQLGLGLQGGEGLSDVAVPAASTRGGKMGEINILNKKFTFWAQQVPNY
jgi:hypothetical protein